MGIINSHLKGTTKRWASIFKIVKYIYIYIFFYGFIFSLSSEVHSSALSLILAPVEPKAHSNALWFSINPASMKSQGANAEKRANLPVYTISSYTEALAPAPKNPQLPPHTQHVCRSVHAEQSDCIIWACSSICVAASPETCFKLCHPQLRRSLKNGRREPCKVDIFSSLP